MPANGPDNATLQALWEQVDAERIDTETTWGAQRLALITGDELYAKFRRQQVRWSTLYAAAWQADIMSRSMLDEVSAAAGAMKRAYAAVAAAATEAGHPPIAPWVWEATLSDGTVLAVVQDDDAAAKVSADGRYLRVATMREIANVWDALPKALQVAKMEFPGARFVGTGDRGWLKDGDQVPFGDAA